MIGRVLEGRHHLLHRAAQQFLHPVQQLQHIHHLALPNPQLPHRALTIDEQLVTSILHGVNSHKASGPERLRGRVLLLHSAKRGSHKTVPAASGFWRCPQHVEGVHHNPNPQTDTCQGHEGLQTSRTDICVV